MKKLVILSILLSVIAQVAVKAGPGIPSSEGLYSTMVIVSPTSSTIEFTKDILVKSEYEEAADIVADGVVTDEELEEMSIELAAKVERCVENAKEANRHADAVSCLEHFAQFEDMVGY